MACFVFWFLTIFLCHELNLIIAEIISTILFYWCVGIHSRSTSNCHTSHPLLKVPRLLAFRNLASTLTFFPSRPYLEITGWNPTLAQRNLRITQNLLIPAPLCHHPACHHDHRPTPTKKQGEPGRALGSHHHLQHKRKTYPNGFQMNRSRSSQV